MSSAHAKRGPQVSAGVAVAVERGFGRPDRGVDPGPVLRAAEQARLAAAADVGVAGAALYPSLRLPGTLLLASGAGLLDRVTGIISLALDAKRFDGAAQQADVDAARSRLREATLI